MDRAIKCVLNCKFTIKSKTVSQVFHLVKHAYMILYILLSVGFHFGTSVTFQNRLCQTLRAELKTGESFCYFQNRDFLFYLWMEPNCVTTKPMSQRVKTSSFSTRIVSRRICVRWRSLVFCLSSSAVTHVKCQENILNSWWPVDGDGCGRCCRTICQTLSCLGEESRRWRGAVWIQKVLINEIKDPVSVSLWWSEMCF